MKRISDTDVINLYDITRNGIVTHKITGYRPIIHYSNGYVRCKVCMQGLSRNIRIHRFVALLYIPNPEGYEQVNHKDGDKTNNKVENLEWCTNEQNRVHAIRNGLVKIGRDNTEAKLTTFDVMDIRRRIGKKESFKSIYSDYNHKIGWWSFRSVCRGKSYADIVINK